MTLSSATILPTSTYSIQDKCVLKIGEQEYETLLTYTIYIGKGQISGYDVSIERSNFKVNNEKVDTKFLGIANKYTEALFPLRCTIKDYRLFITNISEINQRIDKTDKEILNAYRGEGVEHIRKNFLDAVKDEEHLRDFLKQLHIMKIFSLGIQKFEKINTYQMDWNILPIGRATWKGEIKYDKAKNSLHYEPKILNAQEIMNKIIHYIHKHEYYVNIDKENVGLYADLVHNVKYTGETGRMKSSETTICIEVENIFLYQQTITLKKT